MWVKCLLQLKHPRQPRKHAGRKAGNAGKGRKGREGRKYVDPAIQFNLNSERSVNTVTKWKNNNAKTKQGTTNLEKSADSTAAPNETARTPTPNHKQPDAKERGDKFVVESSSDGSGNDYDSVLGSSSSKEESDDESSFTFTSSSPDSESEGNDASSTGGCG